MLSESAASGATNPQQSTTSRSVRGHGTTQGPPAPKRNSQAQRKTCGAERCPNLKCPGDSKRNGSNPTCVDRPLRTSEATSVMSHHHRSPGEEWKLWPSRGCLSDRTEPPSKFKLMRSRKERYLANTPACMSGSTGSTRGCSVMSYKASRSQSGPGAVQTRGRPGIRDASLVKMLHQKYLLKYVCVRIKKISPLESSYKMPDSSQHSNNCFANRLFITPHFLAKIM